VNIAIVDYGMGNIKSLHSAFKYIGCDNISVTSNEAALTHADKIVLPGVGAFGRAMKLISSSGLDLVLQELILDRKKPILGICLGMQLLGQSSNENGESKGLGFVDAVVDNFELDEGLSVPHVGYNQIQANNSSRLYRSMNKVLDFYFVHGYKMSSDQDIGQSMCHYGENFIASFEVDNITGTQFHPELSQKNGLQVLKNFIELF